VKQQLSPGVTIGILAVVALIVVGLLWRAFSGPSSSQVAPSTPRSEGGMPRGKARVEEMRQRQMERTGNMQGGGVAAPSGNP
jgi:hypothetical protein